MPALVRDPYVNLPLSQRCLISQTRFTCTNAKADNGRPTHPCRFCCSNVPETIIHLSCSCLFFQGPRIALWCPNSPPVTQDQAWFAMFKFPLRSLVQFLQMLDSLFYLRTNVKLFSHPSTNDDDSNAFISRHNAVTNFT